MSESDPFDLRVQAEDKRKADEKARLLRLREEDDLKWLMQHKQGRRFMWRLLGIAGLYRNPMQGDGDAFTNLRCGMQAVGQQMVAEIHGLCPERYFEMVKEQQGSDGRDEAQR